MAGFYLDNDVSVRLQPDLQALGHGVVHTRDRHSYRASDALQLLDAAENGWVLVSYNRSDYRLLHEAWLLWGGRWNLNPVHSGILIIRQRVFGAVEWAREIDNFVRSVRTLENQLYVWTPGAAWSQYQMRASSS